GADLGERVVEQEVRLVAAEPGVPAEEPEAALGQEGGQVVLGEVHVVVRGDERGRRPGVSRAVIDALAWMTTRAGPAHHRRRQPDEFPDDPGHRPLRSAARPAWAATATASGVKLKLSLDLVVPSGQVARQ